MPKIAANISMLFREFAMLDRFQAAAAAGFDGVEVGTLADAQSILDRCRQRVALQFDLYHVARMGLDPAAELKQWLPLVRHVQFADAPDRHEPGTGGLRFDTVLRVLNAGAYGGWLSAEYSPLAATAAGLGWLGSWRRGAFGRAEMALDI
jgi:hydroxypyruvate isomerase